jgi:hypothetical protein
MRLRAQRFFAKPPLETGHANKRRGSNGHFVPAVTTETRHRIVWLSHQGLSQRAIAAEVGFSQVTVGKVLKQQRHTR